MKLFDAHCHLQDDRLLERIGEVMVSASEAGVAAMVCCGCEEADWGTVAALAENHPEIVPAFGLHPWYVARRSPAWFDRLEEALVTNPRAGVGEIGLDHALTERRDEEQMEVFVEQLRLARRLGRPVSIHCRKAWEALHRALERVGELPAGFVVHSYGGSAETVVELAARGGFFSFSGAITHPRSTRSRAACAAVPEDRLLIETDAPDLTPSIVSDDMPFNHAPATEGPNEPRHIGHVLRAVARVRGMSPESLAALTWANAERLFGRVTRLTSGIFVKSTGDRQPI